MLLEATAAHELAQLWVLAVSADGNTVFAGAVGGDQVWILHESGVSLGHIGGLPAGNDLATLCWSCTRARPAGRPLSG